MLKKKINWIKDKNESVLYKKNKSAHKQNRQILIPTQTTQQINKNEIFIYFVFLLKYNYYYWYYHCLIFFYFK